MSPNTSQASFSAECFRSREDNAVDISLVSVFPLQVSKVAEKDDTDALLEVTESGGDAVHRSWREYLPKLVSWWSSVSGAPYLALADSRQYKNCSLSMYTSTHYFNK